MSRVGICSLLTQKAVSHALFNRNALSGDKVKYENRYFGFISEISDIFSSWSIYIDSDIERYIYLNFKLF